MGVGSPLVDLYSHSGQPGYEARETLETLLAAAAARWGAAFNPLTNHKPRD